MLQLAVFESSSATARMVADWSYKARDLIVRTDEHGYADLSAFIPMSRDEAFWFYDRRGLPHVTLTADGFPVYEGRLEDPAIVPGGIRITAYGYWRALTDGRYTALWSDDSLDRWRPMLESELLIARPDRFEFDQQDRLYIAPRKGDVQGTTGASKTGLFGYEPPDGSSNDILAVSFDWTMLGPATWTAAYQRRDSTWTQLATTTIVTGTGAVQTGTVTATLAACDRLTISFRSTAADAALATETGEAVYFYVTDIRVKGTTSSTVDGDLVIPDLLATTPLLSSSTALIQSPGIDLRHETYEDARPADILDDYCALGDSSSIVRMWEAGVYEGRRLHFRPRGSAGKTWYVDLAEFDVERSLEALYNAVYATYQTPSGNRELRTATSTDTTSVARYGVTRTDAVSSGGSTSTQAIIERNAHLTDHKDPTARASITVAAVYSATGAPWPLWCVRSGDTVVIRNLPPTASTEINKIQSFVISGTTYNVDANTLDIEPENPPARMAWLLAGRGERINRARERLRNRRRKR